VGRTGDGVDPILVGWREWLALPDLGVAAIKAKIDTGARTSALHVERLEYFELDGRRWVRFELEPRSRRHGKPLVCEAPIVDERPVTDSGGDRALRPFIRTLVAIGPEVWGIEINLTNRRSMMFPLLLGRTAMRGRLQVDPEQSFVLGRPRRRKTKGRAA
jgi:hypothetical protein